MHSTAPNSDRSNCGFGVFTAKQAFPQCCDVDSCIPRNLCVRSHAPAPHKAHVDSCVVALLNSGCPSAIIKRVRSVIVREAINGMFWRARSHVGQERREIVVPSLAYCDSSASVVVVLRMASAKAAGAHVLPRGIFTCPASSAASAMLERQLGDTLFAQATATLLLTRPQRSRSRNSDATAVAPTLNVVWPARTRRTKVGNDDEAPKSITKLNAHLAIIQCDADHVLARVETA